MSSNVLLYLEHDGRRLQAEMPRLVAKGNELAEALKGFTIGCLVGDIGQELLAEARELKCGEIAVVSDSSLGEYHPEPFRSAIETVLDATAPHLVLFRHSYLSVELAPALAHRYNAPIASNCLEVEAKDSGIEAVRPYLRELCWGRLSLRGAPPYFVTLQRFSTRRESPPKTEPPSVKEIDFRPPSALRISCEGIVQRAESGEDISTAEKIVAVGRGIGDRANLRIVEALAEALGATLACSRPIADLGWLPVERQVGMSGKTVSPKVYLACGISGESQHVAGMKDSSLIIAINSDPRARIFRIAHYGVVADLMSFLPVLTEAALKAKE